MSAFTLLFTVSGALNRVTVWVSQSLMTIRWITRLLTFGDDFKQTSKQIERV